MKLTVKTLLFVILLELICLVCFAGKSFGQTTTVPYDGQAVPVHLSWSAPTPTAGWTLIDYCVGGSNTTGQEHAATPGYKGCGTRVIGTSLDIFPAIGPGFYVVWAEFQNTAGQTALSTDSNEASCDLEVSSATATSTTFYCKGQTQVSVPGKPTGLTATPK